MPIRDQKLVPAFLTALLFVFISPIFFPSIKFTHFAPYLIIAYYRNTFYGSLWQALGAGLIIDLLSFQSFFGLHILTYCFTTLLLYFQKRNFFEQRLSTLAIMTLFFSSFASLIQVALLYLFGQNIALNWRWVAVDLIILSFIDGAYGFCAFSLPYFFIYKLKKVFR